MRITHCIQGKEQSHHHEEIDWISKKYNQQFSDEQFFVAKSYAIARKCDKLTRKVHFFVQPNTLLGRACL